MTSWIRPSLLEVDEPVARTGQRIRRHGVSIDRSGTAPATRSAAGRSRPGRRVGARDGARCRTRGGAAAAATRAADEQNKERGQASHSALTPRRATRFRPRIGPILGAMPVLRSRLDPASPEARANHDAMAALVAELRDRQAAVADARRRRRRPLDRPPSRARQAARPRADRPPARPRLAVPRAEPARRDRPVRRRRPERRDRHRDRRRSRGRPA